MQCHMRMPLGMPNAYVCSKIHNMHMDPRLAWEHICLLMKGEAAHHKKRTTMAMRLLDGSRASNAAENISIFSPHFNHVYNAQRSTPLFLINSLNIIHYGNSTTQSPGKNSVKQLKNSKMPKHLDSLVSHRRHSRPCPPPTFIMSTSMSMTSSLVMLIIINGIVANVCLCQKVATSLIPTNGEELC